MTNTRAQQRYSIATEISLSRNTSYSGKKKEGPRDMGRYIIFTI